MYIKWFKAFTYLILYVFLTNNSYAYTSPPSDKIVPIKIAMYVNDVSAINEPQETIEIELSIFFRWNDKRLAYNPPTATTKLKYYYDEAALRKIQTIWHPNVTIQQLRGAQNIYKRYLAISPEGVVTYLQRFQAEIETVIDVRRFPFDTQVLHISAVPFTDSHHRMQFIIEKDKEGIASNAHLSEWEILGYAGSVSNVSSLILGGKIPSYTFSIKYKRLWPFYFINLILPLFMIVFLSWSVFWVKDFTTINSIAVSFTAFLTIVAFQWIATNSIPKVSYPTLFRTFVLYSYFMIGLSIFFLVLLDNIKIKTAEKLRMHLKWLFPLIYALGISAIAIYFI